MRPSQNKLAELVTPLVDALLYEAWDPIGVHDRMNDGVYANYTPKAAQLAVENDPGKLGNYLHSLATVDMGLASRTLEPDMNAARAIIDAAQKLLHFATNPTGYALLTSLIEFSRQASRESHLTGLSIFGSVARAMHRADSDIDLLVRFPSDHEPTLLQLAHLANQAEDLLGRKTDLVLDGDHLRPSFRRRIEKDRIRVA